MVDTGSPSVRIARDVVFKQVTCSPEVVVIMRSPDWWSSSSGRRERASYSTAPPFTPHYPPHRIKFLMRRCALALRCLCSSQNAPRIRTGGSAGAPDVAPPPRCWRATRLRWPTACRWPGGDTLRSPASPACIFATASSDPGRSLSMRSRTAVVVVSRLRFLPLPAFANPGVVPGLHSPGRPATLAAYGD